MAQKFTMFFTFAAEGYGFTEDYWWIGTNVVPTLIPLLLGYAQTRAALLSADCNVDRIRLQGQFKRDPLIFDYSQQPYTGGGQTGNCNNIDNAVLVRSESANVGYNRTLMRGIPDPLINSNLFTPDANWIAAFNAWRNILITSGNFAVVAAVDNPQPPKTPATISQNSPRGIKVVMQAGDTLSVGTQVIVRGSSMFGYNGVKNVVQGPPTLPVGTYILGGARPQSPPSVSDNITLTPRVPLSGPVQQYFYERFTTRAAGRPFGVRRGRRQTTLSLRP